MKIRIISIIIFLFLVVLTACTSKVIKTQTVNEPIEATATEAVLTKAVQTETASTTTPAETIAADTQPETAAALDVEALIREKLQNHHSIERVYNAKHTREEWNATLDRMIGYGAKISEEEKQIIIDYLLQIE
jgi:Na+-transporting methylmalonyl-CoA/oxaloacetate decarboxylase gamma subunit